MFLPRLFAHAVIGLSLLLPTAHAQTLPAPITLNQSWQLQDIAKVTQTGGVLSQPGYKPSGWYKATVPGTVLTSLVNDGVYPEPLYGENNRPDKIPESLCRTSYWYRTTFTVPRSYNNRHVWLNFHGINYQAEVWVNGHDVGSIKGAFTRGIFDITPDVTPGQSAVLAVHVSPQPHPGDPQEQTQAAGVGKNGGITALDGPTFLCTIGWDWIPGIRDRDTGLWQNVTLSATGPVIVQDPYVTSDLPLPRTDSADLTVQTTLRNVTNQPQTGTLTGTAQAFTFRQTVTLKPNETRTVTLDPTTTPALHIANPKLWWPNGYGPQNLDTLHLTFTTNTAVSDAQAVTFGIRKITYAKPGSDNLTLVVNGVPVMAKGGDWGMDEALKRIGHKRLDAQIRMHQLAHYTIIRNWVGQSTSEEFYDLCDKYGILIWDEFFQPNPADGPNPDDVPLYLANVREKILRFRSHPCIALWCARNEGDPPPAIDAGIQTLMTELERQRLYQRSSTSGRGVRSGGPYHWRTPREYYDVDAPFKTEIGSTSIPTLEAVHAMMPQKDWDTINDDWAEHDLAGGAQGGDWYPRTLEARYGPVTNLADFVRKSQLMNYEAFRAMYEGRFAKLFAPASGVITWMSNPAQPSFVWQLYSWDLEPNSSLFATRKACEPVHIQMNQTDWRVMVINNTPQTLNGLTAKTSVYNTDGTLQGTHTDPVTASPSAATDAGAVAFPDTLTPVHFVKVQLYDAQNKLLSDNFYWRADPSHQDDFTTLNTLPIVALDAHATRRDVGSNFVLNVTLHNPTRSVALMTHLQLRNAKTNQRVLPVFYSDNYISLLPGETKTLTVEAAQEDLGKNTPLLAVDGWNVTVRPVTSGPVRIVPNADALNLKTPAPPTAVSPSLGISINCGGGSSGPFRFGAPPTDGFGADRDFNGGLTTSSDAAVDTHIPHAAPEFVYKSERYGACVYTVPVAKNKTYTVRLHFAENKFPPGGRKFNVDINGKRMLSDFDIAAEAGGMNKAVVKDFPNVAPNADGSIVITLSRGSADEPKLCGIQILPTSEK